MRSPSLQRSDVFRFVHTQRPLVLDNFIVYLQSLSPALIYAIVFSIAFIENVFPPSPSDLVIVFGGSLVGIGRVGFIETLLWSTAGSTLGFVVMYKVGDWFGDRILAQGKLKFIPAESVRKVDEWFRRYGLWLIVANRFLAGTRAVVSFFAGMAQLRLLPTIVLCALSALTWNALLITGGYYLGNNWREIGRYLGTYSEAVTGLIVVLAIVFIARYFYRRKTGRGGQ
jgi:membrane protein DedA with SNARE-associated domain